MEKLRVIMTTDSEIDDKCSMLRFLLYTNEFDVEALISVNSKWQKDGHGEIWIHEMIDKYKEVYDNLKSYDENYPTPNYLHSKVIQGPVDRAPLYADCPPYNDGYTTNFIIEKLLDNDPRPLYVSMWGGGTLMANVFWHLQNKYSQEDCEKAISKVRMYFIDYQEFGKGGGQWLRDNVPQAQNILDYQFHETYAYKPRSRMPYEEYMGEDWLNENVKYNHGPLGSSYFVMRNGLYVSEGDTPSYLWLVPNGLRSHENPSFGGWGGRHENIGDNQWNDAFDDGDVKKPLWRWTKDVQNDWAMRLDWCVMQNNEATVPPVVVVDCKTDIVALAGEEVTLNAEGSFNPKGCEVDIKWWRYYDADSCKSQVEIHSDGAKVTLKVPNEKGESIHMICEVANKEGLEIKRYARIIINIA